MSKRFLFQCLELKASNKFGVNCVNRSPVDDEYKPLRRRSKKVPMQTVMPRLQA